MLQYLYWLSTRGILTKPKPTWAVQPKPKYIPDNANTYFVSTHNLQYPQQQNVNDKCNTQWFWLCGTDPWPMPTHRDYSNSDSGHQPRNTSTTLKWWTSHWWAGPVWARSVDLNERGVACESSVVWFHASCQNIGSQAYMNKLNWHLTALCCMC